jgi:hypothetical protein
MVGEIWKSVENVAVRRALPIVQLDHLNFLKRRHSLVSNVTGV